MAMISSLNIWVLLVCVCFFCIFLSTIFLSFPAHAVDFPWKSGDFWLSAHVWMKALVDYSKVAVWVSSKVQLGLLPAEPPGAMRGGELCVWGRSAGLEALGQCYLEQMGKQGGAKRMTP